MAAAVAAGQQDLAEKKLLALTQIILPAREADVAYGIYYGASGNTPPVLDVSRARDELGYVPQDDVGELLEN